MASFRGHSYRSLDDKGRLLLPSEFRSPLDNGNGAKVILTNLDGCVVGYPLEEWTKIESGFSKVNFLSRQLRALHRFFVSGAVEVALDKQGRILIPSHLRNYAKLSREVVLAGVGHKFEIWDRERFEISQQELDANIDQIMDGLKNEGVELPI